RESDLFSNLERAAIEYAERLTRTPADVPDELFDRLRAELDEPQLVELTAAIAGENYVARFNRGFAVTPDDSAPAGACCVPPARQGNLVACFRAVAVHASQQNLPRSPLCALARPLHGVAAHGGAAPVHEHLVVVVHALRVDRQHGALTAEHLRQLSDQLGTGH